MGKSTITVSFETLTKLLRQCVFLSEFDVIGASVSCHGIEAHIQGEVLQDGLVVPAIAPLGPEDDAIALAAQDTSEGEARKPRKKRQREP